MLKLTVTDIHEYPQAQGYLGVEGHVGKYAVGEYVVQLVAAGIRYVFGERRHGAALVGEQESGQGIPYERHPHDRFVVDYPCESEARHEEEYLEKAFVYPAGQPRFAQRVVHLPCQYAAGRDERTKNETKFVPGARMTMG